MKKELYFVEVGVLLDPADDEYNYYYVDNFGALYDEGRKAFFEQEKAQEWLDCYVKNGVPNTYGILHSYICNIDDRQVKWIEEEGFYPYIDNPTLETTLYYGYKSKYGLITTIINKEELC